MKRYKFTIIISLLSIVLYGCIDNDIPYPRIEQYITAISAAGESAPAIIDNSEMTVTLTLSEQVDIRKVRFETFEYTENAEPSKNLLIGSYDLSNPLSVCLKKYQTYEWVIIAQQQIERYFEISGQIGESIIDVPAKRVIVKVPDNVILSDLHVIRAKLGAANVSTMTPDLNNKNYNFTKPVHINVDVFGEREDWTIYVEVTKSIVTTISADAWSQVIWAYGAAPADSKIGFEYRSIDNSEWESVPENCVVKKGGAFSCYIPHLKPLTHYLVRAVSDENKGNEIEVLTQSVQTLPGGDFDQWWLNGKVWCPWEQSGEKYWDTGNVGAATLGQSNVIPSDDTPIGIGKSVKLETKFVGLMGIGKLAAGSIFTGSFRKVDGTNGILDFGQPWQLRPTKLHGYMKYNTAPIDYVSDEFKGIIGRPDTCHIYVVLADWTAPYEIRTNPKNRHLLDLNSDAIIAYGELLCGQNTNGWKNFDIDINYRSTSRIPRYILITAAASKYGDYFTGGTGSTLFVDQFSLDYDY